MLQKIVTPSKKNFRLLDCIESGLGSVPIQSKKRSIRVQTDVIDKRSKNTNTLNNFDGMLTQGKSMNADAFEKFVQGI